MLSVSCSILWEEKPILCCHYQCCYCSPHRSDVHIRRKFRRVSLWDTCVNCSAQAQVSVSWWSTRTNGVGLPDIYHIFDTRYLTNHQNPKGFFSSLLPKRGLSITLQAEHAGKNIGSMAHFLNHAKHAGTSFYSTGICHQKHGKKTQLKPGQNCNSHQLWLMTRRLLQHFSRGTEDAGLQTGQKSEQIFTVATRGQSWCCLT